MTEVRLFGTCLAEEFFPSVVGATASILEDLKIKVRPMGRAFCCGQAPFNEGLRGKQACQLRDKILQAQASLHGREAATPPGARSMDR